MDEPPLALTAQDPLLEAGQVRPPLRRKCPHFGRHGGVPRLHGHVLHLVGVSGQVVQQWRLLTVDVLVLPPLDHVPAARSHLRGVLAVHGVISCHLTRFRVAEEATAHRAAFDGERNRLLPAPARHYVDKRWHEVGQGDITLNVPCRQGQAVLGPHLVCSPEEKRHSGGTLVEGLLEPHPPLALHVSMVRRQDHQGVVLQPLVPQLLQHAPNQAVYKAEHRVVCPARLEDPFLGYLKVSAVHALVDTP
mmetsp:Transcript_26142/g.67585  ORF Transcript_26142/g.67585 Transcript_26142/m.67585 type:complete len:248 (-) Transcript_26142:837-1580(-)